MSTNAAADAATVARAQRVVLGVVKARQIDSAADAHLLIDSYLADEVKLGRSPESAWALLFSASASWLAAMISSDAVHHGTTPGARLTALSLAHAAEQA